MLKYEDAYNDIIDYLDGLSDEHFVEYGTTREAVMADKDKLEELAFEHYKCVNNFGNERSWSCKDACEFDPGFWHSEEE